MKSSEPAAKRQRLGDCQVCRIETARYTCPACGWKSCSAHCTKEHKQAQDCSGQRDKIAYVPAKEYSYRHFMGDYVYLEDIARKAAEWGSEISKLPRPRHTAMGRGDQPGTERRRGPVPFGVPTSRREEELRVRACGQEIDLLFLPTGMHRKQLNQTQYRSKKRDISWTCTVTFFEATSTGKNSSAIALHSSSSNSTPAQLLKKLVSLKTGANILSVAVRDHLIRLLGEDAVEGGKGKGHMRQGYLSTVEQLDDLVCFIRVPVLPSRSQVRRAEEHPEPKLPQIRARDEPKGPVISLMQGLPAAPSFLPQKPVDIVPPAQPAVAEPVKPQPLPTTAPSSMLAAALAPITRGNLPAKPAVAQPHSARMSLLALAMADDEISDSDSSDDTGSDTSSDDSDDTQSRAVRQIWLLPVNEPLSTSLRKTMIVEFPEIFICARSELQAKLRSGQLVLADAHDRHTRSIHLERYPAPTNGTMRQWGSKENLDPIEAAPSPQEETEQIHEEDELPVPVPRYGLVDYNSE